MSTEKRFESDRGSRINNEDDYDTSFEINNFDVHNLYKEFLIIFAKMTQNDENYIH